MKQLFYYELVRQGDEHTVTGAFFKSITIHTDKENEINEFPPKEGDHIIVFNDIFNYWRTTEVQQVEKLNEDEYEFTTLNSIYIIKKLPLKI